MKNRDQQMFSTDAAQPVEQDIPCSQLDLTTYLLVHDGMLSKHN